MAILDIVFGPSPIFKQKAEAFEVIDGEAIRLAEDMLETMYEYRGIGIAANMVGVAKRVIVVDLQQEGVRMPYVLFNPEVTWSSEETATNEEASLSFPGVSAKVTRPASIKLSYLDKKGEAKELEAKDWFATVIQHEMDYLDGRTYLDRISKMKRDRLLKKMQKNMKQDQTCCDDPTCDKK
ncbi:MAG: peptide deformylase [Kordiimonas sp.]